MEKSGPERDKRIAKLKGDVPNDGGQCYWFAMKIKMPSCGRCHECNEFENWESYSTKITSASTLLPDHFELSSFKSNELGHCAHMKIYKEGPTWTGSRTVLASHESEHHETKEAAIADAVSGAWLLAQ